MRVLLVIPARLGSTRLPQKPLQILCGEPLVRVVARRACALGLDAEIVVASDDQRVLHAVEGLPVRGLLTEPEHRSGTERVAEVLRRPEYAAPAFVINVQCDHPFLPAAAIQAALGQLVSGRVRGTVAGVLDPSDMSNPHRVKVAVDERGYATTFSRLPIPRPPAGSGCRIFHHLGIYAYTRDALLDWVDLPGCREERVAGLEQLRPLMHGRPIGVALLDGPIPMSIDSPEDLRRARAWPMDATDYPWGDLSRMSA